MSKFPQELRDSGWTPSDDIGAGGQAVVRLAEHKATQIVAVVKVAKGDRSKVRINKEAELLEKAAAAGVRVPAVLRFGDGWILLERIEGGSMVKPAAGVRLPAGDMLGTLRLFRRIVVEVGRLHAAGIVHRDLKPENILLVVDGQGTVEPVLADFGIGRDTGEDSDLTEHEERVGTRDYMAPELEDHSADVSELADSYSLGKMLWWMLDGFNPKGRTVPREGFRSESWDLVRRNGRADLGFAREILERTIVTRPEDRASAVLLPADVDRVIHAVATVRTPWSARSACRICGLGAYRVIVKEFEQDQQGQKAKTYSHKDANSLIGVGAFGGDWRILVCQRCGHVAMFRPDLARSFRDWEV